jgi:DNA polymerase III subunit epsilon
MAVPSPFARPVGTVVSRRPTTLSARAAECLAAGPLDAVTLMRDVCQVARLQPDAAERMAIALLSSHEEFERLPSGHWALCESARADRDATATAVRPTPDGEVLPPTATSATGLMAVDFAVVDVETTGTRVADRVTEIAIARVSGGEVQDVYTQLVNPQRPIPAHITALTHITWAMVKDQPPFGQIAPEVVRRLAGHVFTAHNAAFDWRFVSNELTRGGLRLSGPRLCTVRLARLLLPRLSRRSLDHVTRYFGIEISARHRAAGDAEATARALLRMLRIAEGEGVSSWHALEARLSTATVRRRQSAADRRRRAFPLPVTEDHIA